MNIIVNVSDARVSADPADTLTTYALGSCIGVALFDPQTKVAGLLHYQLPSATMDPAKAKQNPHMFGDSGMDALLGDMQKHGCQKKRMKVKLAGAAQMLNDTGMFNIGRRNHAAIRKILWQHGMLIDSEDVGGTAPRTMHLSVADGSLSIKTGGGTLSR